MILQNKKNFNFLDLVEKFAPSKTDPLVSGSHFNILSIKIKEGEFHYLENETPINYFIKEVNFENAGKRWDSDTIAASFSFRAGVGSGFVKGNFMINF